MTLVEDLATPRRRSRPHTSRAAVVGAQPASAFEVAKVALPTLRQLTVDKTAVIAGLVASSRPFTTVIAPAGYGKTTLVVRWASADPRPFAWLSLDDRDNDGLAFLRGIAAAIDRIEPISDEVFDGPAEDAASVGTLVTRLGRAFARLKQPIVLALDGLHAVTDPACFALLSSLLDYVPADSGVVITSRERPALPLARWRARGLLDEVAASDLRLDQNEADRLLRGAGVALEPADVADLTERTEGWPAGLYLSALSLRTGVPAPSGVRDLSGRDRFLSEYLRLEVLSRVDDDVADFLLRSSILEKMTGPLCDAVLETTGSANVLDRLEHSNRFVVPLDREGRAYRYHHMFRQLLQDELQRSKPDAVALLNRRAMLWCMVNAEPEQAAHYAEAAGDTGTVAQLVDRLASSMGQDGRSETVDKWLGWLDAATWRPCRPEPPTADPSECRQAEALAPDVTSRSPSTQQGRSVSGAGP